MKNSFNSLGIYHSGQQVDLELVKNSTVETLKCAAAYLESKGVSTDFAKAALPANNNGDGQLAAGFLFDMLFFGLFSSIDGLAALETVGQAIAIGDAGAMVIDHEANARRRQSLRRRWKGGEYPEGRRKARFDSARLLRGKFNPGARRQQPVQTQDGLEEIAKLAELLRMIDRLERKGVCSVYVGNEETAFDSLKQVDKDFGKGAMRSYSRPMRIAV